MKKGLLLIFFIQMSLFVFSQSDSTAYQRFFAYYLKQYKEESKQPLGNFFVVLTNAAQNTFFVENPLFVNALTELSNRLNISEDVAFDSLFQKTLRDAKENYLWVNSLEIYNKEKPFFELYNHHLCNCLTQQISKKDRMDKLMAALQTCTGRLIVDTGYTNAMKRIAGDKTLNDLNKLQNYLTMYVYQNCEIINYKFNEAAFGYPVYGQYNSGLELLKETQAENAIKYFKAKQLDSLSNIFPNHKKFMKTFNTILSKSKANGVTFRSNYMARRKDENPKTYVTLF
jgi:hypothetical protein